LNARTDALIPLKTAVVVGCTAAFLARAPLQCGREPDASHRRAETPAEALYGLAAKFRASGDVRAWRTTLAYLIERYPNSRFALMAKDDLQGDGGADGG
jgi:hypothetical protein